MLPTRMAGLAPEIFRGHKPDPTRCTIVRRDKRAVPPGIGGSAQRQLIQQRPAKCGRQQRATSSDNSEPIARERNAEPSAGQKRRQACNFRHSGGCGCFGPLAGKPSNSSNHEASSRNPECAAGCSRATSSHNRRPGTRKSRGCAIRGGRRSSRFSSRCAQHSDNTTHTSIHN